MNDANKSNRADLIECLSKLEYGIRQSMTVREDQDEPANLQHVDEAVRHGIVIEVGISKGDLLNAVQTLVRSLQRENSNSK